MAGLVPSRNHPVEPLLLAPSRPLGSRLSCKTRSPAAFRRNRETKKRAKDISSMLYDVIWCYMMLYDFVWCDMMLYDVISNKNGTISWSHTFVDLYHYVPVFEELGVVNFQCLPGWSPHLIGPVAHMQSRSGSFAVEVVGQLVGDYVEETRVWQASASSCTSECPYPIHLLVILVSIS